MKLTQNQIWFQITTPFKEPFGLNSRYNKTYMFHAEDSQNAPHHKQNPTTKS